MGFHCVVGFTGMCVDHVPSPAANAKNKVEHIYTGPMDTELSESMCACDPDVSQNVHFPPNQCIYINK